MRICAAWLLKHAAASSRRSRRGKPPVFMSGRCSLTPILRSLGRGFLARTRFSTLTTRTTLPLLGAMQRNMLWKMRRNWSRTRPKPCSPWVIINIGCCVITGSAKTTFGRVSKMLPGNSEVLMPSAQLPDARDTGMKALPTWSKPSLWTHVMWSYLMDAAWTYAMLRQFPAALKLYDRALDISQTIRI